MMYEMISGVNPYKNTMKNSYDRMKDVGNVEIQMLPTFSKNAVSILSGLLTKNVILFTLIP